MPHPEHAAPGRNRPLIIAGVVVIAILAFAAGMLLANSGDDGGASGPPTATTPSGATSASGQPSESSTAAMPVLEDGRHFVFVKKLHGTPPDATVTFDLADFLTGDAANQAAAERGDETPVPNDYYIVNDNPRLRTMPLSPTVRIDAIDWTNCCELTSVPYTDWAASLTHPTDALLGAQVPYWIVVADGQVTKIEEQYLP